MDDIEYEATFTDIDIEKLSEKLNKIGAKNVHERFLMSRIALNLHDNREREWTRVRKEYDSITMTYKNVDPGTIEGQKEVEIQIDSFENGVEILKRIGCIEKAYQENYRETWDLEGVIITIDEWPFLEPFVEIEGKSEGAVRDISERLGFEWGDAVFDAVTGLYAEKYSISRDRINNQTPKIIFEMENPFN